MFLFKMLKPSPDIFLSEFFNFLLASHTLPTFTPNIPTFKSSRRKSMRMIRGQRSPYDLLVPRLTNSTRDRRGYK